MQAFYYANNTGQEIDAGGKFHIVGELDLQPGAYAVWGTLSVGVSALWGYPPPPYPFGGGAATLVYADGDDQAFVGVKPEDGENNETVTLMTCARSDAAAPARLYFLNPWPLPVYIAHVRIIALAVDLVSSNVVGEDNSILPTDSSQIVGQGMKWGKMVGMPSLIRKLRG